ncbi:hypothetical protein [Falsirhodobacter halotolerans]|uniref:hypothetical protein n=1 Tax=Falsirhodobacter halotolerans TaxID=1146892 RepID=UPI001FD4C9CE|nr:hypothetical protein [Falsirhodobacter halotolerans]MCJ8139583.1 hypothetical protein [Falsirhodobacter halotolerans]
MEIGRIARSTRIIGESQGYAVLAVRDETFTCSVNGPDTPKMLTAWFPSPAELEALLNGAPIIVSIIGRDHPPIMLSVGDLPG